MSDGTLLSAASPRAQRFPHIIFCNEVRCDADCPVFVSSCLRDGSVLDQYCAGVSLDAEAKPDRFGRTMLGFACRRGPEKITSQELEIVRIGAVDIMSGRDSRRTATLFSAHRGGSLRFSILAKDLLECGADASAPSGKAQESWGRTQRTA